MLKPSQGRGAGRSIRRRVLRTRRDTPTPTIMVKNRLVLMEGQAGTSVVRTAMSTVQEAAVGRGELGSTGSVVSMTMAIDGMSGPVVITAQAPAGTADPTKCEA